MAWNYDTLKLNTEFRRIYARGKSYVSQGLVMYVMKRRGNNLRVGITAGKKVGGAVSRNRARRVIRSAFSQFAPRVQRGYDIVFVARARTVEQKSTEVAVAMEKHLIAAGILSEKE